MDAPVDFAAASVNLAAFFLLTASLVARPVLQRTHVQVLVVLASAHVNVSAAHRDSDTLVRVLPGLSIGRAPYQAARRIVLLGEDVRAALAARRAANYVNVAGCVQVQVRSQVGDGAENREHVARGVVLRQPVLEWN